MDETVARAELPSLDIEITHRRLPDEGAEFLAISLRAAPSFAAAARLLEAHGPMTMWPWWLALAPYAAWTRMMRAAWAPWLPAGAARPDARRLPGRAEERGRLKGPRDA